MTKAIAEIIWFAALVGWYVIRHPFARRARKAGVRASYLDWRERALLAMSAIGLLVIPLVYAATGAPARLDRPFVPALAWAGVAALALALWLFRLSHAALGRNWSVTLTVRDAHTVVKTGVYRYVRHPMYTSFFALAFAQLLLLPNWLAGGAGLVGIAMLFWFRVEREERMLLASFGEEYRAYMASTKRLVPWVL